MSKVYLNAKSFANSSDYTNNQRRLGKQSKRETKNYLSVENIKSIKEKRFNMNKPLDLNYTSCERKLLKDAFKLINIKNRSEAARLDQINNRQEKKDNLIDLNQLEHPKIRLKFGLAKVPPLPSGHNLPPINAENLKSIHSKYYSSLIKDYDLVIMNKFELPLKKLNNDQFVRRDIKPIESNKTDDKSLLIEPKQQVDYSLEFVKLPSIKWSRPTSQISIVSRKSSISEYSNDLRAISTTLFDNSTENFLKQQQPKSQVNSNGQHKTNRKKVKLQQQASKQENSTIRNYFRHQVRIVIGLIKILEFAALKTKIPKSAYLKMQTSSDQISDIVQDSFMPANDEDQIVFNKDFYKAKKETQVGKEMQYALTIPPDARSIDQIKMLRIGLSRIDSFVEYPINMQEKICRCAFYQKVPAKRVIIRQGQIADSFYFIITGQAMVTILEEDKKTNETKSRYVAVLKEGACFGELAFLYNTTRTATVTSLSNMELISIGREDFYDIFMSNRGEEPEHIRFLRSCEFINGWPIHVLLQSPQNCLFHYYKRGQIIVQNSHENEYIYIVKSGTCQVLKKLNEVKPRNLLPRRVDQSKENSLYDSFKCKIDSRLKNQNTDSNIPWSVTSLDQVEIAKKEAKPIFLRIQLLKEGDTFGLNTLKFDESDRNVPNPELSLVSDGSEVLMLRKDIFLRYADETVKTNVRRLVQPFPESEAMQNKLQVSADWKHFKNKIMINLSNEMAQKSKIKKEQAFKPFSN